jgi:hypothetical protein
MLSYLKGFFEEFEYDADDGEYFIEVYKKIRENAQASKILDEALAAYEANINLDYKEEILKRAGDISDVCGIHPYVTDLLIFICMSKHLLQVYKERGIDLAIYKNSLLDLKWKLTECKLVRGIRGTFVGYWFSGFFDLTRVALGRLQFELYPIGFDYEKDGVFYKSGESLIINVHIPRSGEPFTKEACDKAYAAAREYFKDKGGLTLPFACYSWMLFPENKNILSPKSNTYRFMSEYEIIEWQYNNGEGNWRIFDTHELNPDKLPQDTFLRRAYVEHMKRGGRVGWGYGLKFN